MQFRYAMDGYAESDLVRISIFVNGDLVDALSFIAPPGGRGKRGRAICARLKEVDSRSSCSRSLSKAAIVAG